MHSSVKWAQVLRPSNHSFWHVAVFNSNDPSDTLSLLDVACAAVESAVGHAHLFSSIEDDSDAVAYLVVMHYSSDVHSAAFALATS
tara:strand:+ start:373 stop:630 length:258 start_codon:yes stop_codon:yes gene_type:complete